MTPWSVPSPLYVVCDQEACEQNGWTMLDFASTCLDAGATFLQVRAKHASGKLFEQTLAAIVDRARDVGALVVVNDRADIARVTGAGGVHVGQEDLSPTAVRSIVGDRAVVGLSTHTSEQVRVGLREPVSYIAIGPVYGTATKETGHDPIGVARVQELAKELASSGVPLVAIGGITLDRAADVVGAGACAVAVIRDLLSTGNPARRVREYLDRLAAR